MPAGKKRDFPPPGTHAKCRTCEVSLICISGRRRFGERHWCDKCRGVYYRDLDMVIRCVVFRNKRGRYQRALHCPACADITPASTTHWPDRSEPTYKPQKVVEGKGHGRIVNGITHRDAQAWKMASRQLAHNEPDGALSADSPTRTRNP